MPIELPPELTAAELEKNKLETRILSLKREVDEVKRLVRYWNDVAEVRARELEAIAALGKMNSPILIEPSEKTGTSETTAILNLGDWHSEEIVDPEKVGGMNKYDLKIADQRIRKVFDGAVTLLNIWRSQTKIDTMVTHFPGDLITGHIHDDTVENTSLHPIQAIRWVQERAASGITYLLEHGGIQKMSVVCEVGNHGRTTDKMRVAMRNETSYEWLMYHTLALIFKDDPRVTFSIATGYFSKAEIYGRIFRMHHGDDIRYSGGIGGISIPVNKAIAEWNTAWTPYMDIFGHYHQHHDNAFWTCIGSLIGYSPFSIACKGKFEPPSQSMLFIEKKKGKTANLQILV
jgi:hypothetical protein